MFELGKWYKTSDGFDVEFIRHKKDDGMYNVFRHTKDLDYRPYYTDENGKTAYGTQVFKFAKVSCSQCGGTFGPRNSGYSHCEDHRI